ncbi:MAG: type IV pilus twitching motility protein PilT [Nitrospirota bacterium]|nr:type IV pilus twitching motility protein PilT [Nitrospirota bacterium]
MNIADLLKAVVTNGASDLHLKSGKVPMVRVDGNLVAVQGAPTLPAEAAQQLAFSMMNDTQRESFIRTGEGDLAYSYPGVGRFRVNAYKQRGSVSMVFRVVATQVNTIEELNLPPVLHKIAGESRGLILVTGSTGSGKSTTLAAMMEHINTTKAANIITIEDPIEYLYQDKKSLISQREVGYDTESFGVALRAALRQDPDVILVGEMRDYETIHTALVAAETGHLVMSTLHTMDAAETINRIIGVFPPFQQKQVRLQLASVLKGVISQRLIPRTDIKGRVASVEVMVSTQTVREAIIDPEKTRKLKDVIAQGGSQYGMQTFDQSLFDLMQRGLINEEAALAYATNPEDFRLKLSGVSSTSDSAAWGDKEQSSENDPNKMQVDRF